jgi:hypothetical protein
MAAMATRSTQAVTALLILPTVSCSSSGFVVFKFAEEVCVLVNAVRKKISEKLKVILLYVLTK